MRSWPAPRVPGLLGRGPDPVLLDHVRGEPRPVSQDGSTATVYVCGITPYDATHLGHAFTYLAYDILTRSLLDAGVTVATAQNVTDVDDPLLERAQRDGVDWQELAAAQVQRYRDDMTALGIIPPDHLVAVTEAIDAIAQDVVALVQRGFGYRVASKHADEDVYFDVDRADDQLPAWSLGEISGLTRDRMGRVFAEHGGDPKRRGKRSRLDPLLWRSARQGEPAWTVSGLPDGRPGWHIECEAVARRMLGDTFDVQGGGRDLLFPHHEMSAAHATALTGVAQARVYSACGMVSYQGHKMSKSRGNLVLVADLLGRADATALRTALLAHRYRDDWAWHDADLDTAVRRVSAWREGWRRGQAAAAGRPGVELRAAPVTMTLAASMPETVGRLREAVAQDLDTPTALDVLDDWAGADEPGDPGLVAAAAQALLGLDLTSHAHDLTDGSAGA